jgi:hypothetical protein
LWAAKSVVQDVQEGMATWLWAASKKCRWGGRSYLVCCMLRRWPGWTTRVIVAAKPEDCAISFGNSIRNFFYRRRAPTRGQCHSGRFCARFHKAFRLGASITVSQDSKELCSIFLHPNVIPNCQRIGIANSAAKKRKERKKKFALPRQQRAGTIN